VKPVYDYHPSILVDTGIIVSFYNIKDRYHSQVLSFFSTCTSRLVTTVACVTEVMWLLAPDIRVQNEFLSALEKEVFFCEPLRPSDYNRIGDLNFIYQNLPRDFTDISLGASHLCSK
jgi:predicted nucleic acid-binding protein